MVGLLELENLVEEMVVLEDLVVEEYLVDLVDKKTLKVPEVAVVAVILVEPPVEEVGEVDLLEIVLFLDLNLQLVLQVVEVEVLE